MRMVGMFAVSLAGHDKDRLYIILKEADEYVYLADGVLRTADRPKKKKQKHIQIIRRDSGLKNRLEAGELVRDEEIKRAIKLYRGEVIQEGKNVKSRCD